VHLRKVHYGCNTCGTRFLNQNDDTKHLNARQKEPSSCQQDLYSRSRFDIDVELYLQMHDIYKRNDATHQQKWAEFWKLFFPGHHTVPDGIHQGTISFPAADIPALLEMCKNDWKRDPAGRGLPLVNDRETENVLSLIEINIRAFNFARPLHFRMQNTEPKCVGHP
jgi:hypothetical protein